MTKYAVIRLQGKEYRVTEGQEILVDKILDPKKVGSEVLLLVDEKKTRIGRPVLKDAKVNLKVLSELEKGEKIDVYKFKAKSRYRKHIGFRAQLTKLLVVSIS